MLLPFGKILLQQGDQAGTGRPHVHNGQPRKTGKPGLRHKGKVHGIEEDRLAPAHRGNANIYPCGLLRRIGRKGNDLAVSGTEQQTAFPPGRGGTQRRHADGTLQGGGCYRSRRRGHHAGKRRCHSKKRIAKSFGHIRCAPALNSLCQFRNAASEQKKRLLFRQLPHAGPGAEADAELHAAHAFKVQRSQHIHSLVEALVIRGGKSKKRGKQRSQPHTQTSVLDKKGDAVRQTLIPPGKNAEQLLKGLRGLRHEGHDQRPVNPVSDADGVPGEQLPFFRPELRPEIRVQHIVTLIPCLRVRQTKRQRIAGNEGFPVPACQLRGDARSDVPQGRMGRQRPCQQIRLPESIQNARQKAVVRIMQRGDGTGNLLTSRNGRSLRHGGSPLFQCRFPQRIGKHRRPCPQNQPACFQSAISFQGISPVIQKTADMQAKILRGKP